MTSAAEPRLGRLAAEPVVAPERLVVHDQRLRLRPGDHPSVERLPVRRQHRVELDLQRQRRRHGHHDPGCVHGDTVGGDHDGVVLLGDRADGRAEVDGVAEVRRHPRGHRTRPALDEVLLRAALDREEGLKAVVAPHQHQEVQERDVVEVARVQPPHGHLEQVAGRAGCGCRWSRGTRRSTGRPTRRPAWPSTASRAAPASSVGRSSTAPTRSWRWPAG